MSRCLLHDQAFLKTLMRSSETFLAWAGITGALCVTLASDQIMGLVFGAQFVDSGIYLGIMIWAVPIVFASGTGRWLLTANNKQAPVLWIQVGGVSTGILLSLILVALFGAIGVAIGYTAGAAVTWMIAYTLASHEPVTPRLTPYILPALVAVIVLIVTNVMTLAVAQSIILAVMTMFSVALVGSDVLKSSLFLARSKSHLETINVSQ